MNILTSPKFWINLFYLGWLGFFSYCYFVSPGMSVNSYAIIAIALTFVYVVLIGGVSEPKRSTNK